MAELGDKPLGDRPRDELEKIVARATELAEQVPAHRFNRFYQRMVAEGVYDRGIPAAEERRAEYENSADEDKGAHPNTGTLQLDPNFQNPAYCEDVEWHLMPGGWDGFDLSMLMFMSGVVPYIFRKGGYAAVDVGADIYAQRTKVLDQLPSDRRYGRIYECGSGGTPTLAMLRQKFPDAELVGADLSGAMQKSGHRMDQKTGLNVHLKQEDCRHTSEPDNHYDAVVAYAVFHETPDDVCAEIIAEMHRILAPGGYMLISDPGPLRALTPYQAVLYDWEGENREEPYFGISIRRNLPQIMRSVGFEDAREYGLGNGNYPWVTIGRKPEIEG
jgi:SAM-dependent methyltransferase